MKRSVISIMVLVFGISACAVCLLLVLGSYTLSPFLSKKQPANVNPIKSHSGIDSINADVLHKPSHIPTEDGFPIIHWSRFIGTNAWVLSNQPPYFFLTENGGATWESVIVEKFNSSTKVYFTNSKDGWAIVNSSIVGNVEILRTTDSGRNWQLLSTIGQASHGVFISAISEILFIDNINGWFSDSAHCWQTNDGGKSWNILYVGGDNYRYAKIITTTLPSENVCFSGQPGETKSQRQEIICS